MERKSEIRKRVIEKRTQLSLEEKRIFDRIITGKVINHSWFLASEEVFCYVPIRGEVDTLPVLEAAWSAGKRVAVPKVLSKTEMEFYYIQSMNDLAPGTFGVLEPLTNENASLEHALMVVPGSVFDMQKNRIGYGGGYYDRYLAAHPNHLTIGIAYSLQVVESLKPEITDIPVQLLLTEKFDL